MIREIRSPVGAPRVHPLHPVAIAATPQKSQTLNMMNVFIVRRWSLRIPVSYYHFPLLKYHRQLRQS